MAIDYGKKWIGLAFTDDEHKLAFPYKTLENNPRFFGALNKIIKDEDIYKIIIGLPLNKKMKATPQTVEVENWTKKLISKVEVPIEFENEILTSRAAMRYQVRDLHSAAAAILLQSYLNKNR